MTEWWTYRPTSFLLFSERTYHRLFELYNAALWPAPVLAPLLGLGLLVLASRRGDRPVRAAAALLAAAWFWVAWAFHLQRYAAINWAATGFAAAFALQGLLLAALTLVGSRHGLGFAVTGRRRVVGLGIVIAAVIGHPLLAPLAGRPWMQAEVFALAPDPTALATLGVLLLLGRDPQARALDGDSPGTAGRTGGAPPRPARRPSLAWLLWPVPLLWCALTGLMLTAMGSPTAGLAPALAFLALITAGVRRSDRLARRRETRDHAEDTG